LTTSLSTRNEKLGAEQDALCYHFNEEVMSQPLIIDIKPVSINQAYSTARTGRRFLVAKGKAYKLEIALLSGKHFKNLVGYSEKLKFTYEIHGPWLRQDGKISKTAGDIDGFCKLMLDAVCEALEINDACVFQIEAKKVVADNWRIIIDLKPIDS
jgi:Holliday junction resolvase RusA-like endonuclease